MLFFVNRRDKTPAYLQLVDQIRYRIAMDQLQAGDLLPTVRDVANQVGMSIHTVARAYEMLENEGLISIRQGQRARVMALKEHASNAKPSTSYANHLEDVLHQVWDDAQKANVTSEAFRAMVDRVMFGANQKLRKVMFIECNQAEANHGAAQISRVLTAEAVPVLLEDLMNHPEKVFDEVGNPIAAVTTFFHINQVKKVLLSRKIPTMGVVLGLQPGLMIQVASLLNSENIIGLVCRDPETMATLVSLVKEVGLVDNQLCVMVMDDPALSERLAKMDGAVVSPAALEITRKLLPSNKPVISLATQISSGSMALLAEELKLTFRESASLPDKSFGG